MSVCGRNSNAVDCACVLRLIEAVGAPKVRNTRCGRYPGPCANENTLGVADESSQTHFVCFSDFENFPKKEKDWWRTVLVRSGVKCVNVV